MAVSAVAAGYAGLNDDALAWLIAVYLSASSKDSPDELVSEYHWRLERASTVVDVHVGPADTTALDLDDDIRGLRLWMRRAY